MLFAPGVDVDDDGKIENRIVCFSGLVANNASCGNESEELNVHPTSKEPSPERETDRTDKGEIHCQLRRLTRL